MRYVVLLLALLAVSAAVPVSATGGHRTKPPKLEKMIKSPVHKKDKTPNPSSTGQQGSGGQGLLHRGG
jgi:hypothetical protein